MKSTPSSDGKDIKRATPMAMEPVVSPMALSNDEGAKPGWVVS